jgi:ribonuclease BN (tRNA processing enzyme)
MSDPVRIRFIGSGDAFGSGGRFQTCILRVSLAGRTITYSGDTEWTDRLIAAASGADLFICESYFYDKPVGFHLDYATLDRQRSRLGCKRLIVTHMSPGMLERVAALPIESAHDGLEITL